MAASSIARMITPPTPHMVGDGFFVHGFFHPDTSHDMSPFLLCDYMAPHYFSPTTRPRGVGAHPHRGFETVTIALRGRIEHHDNAGNQGIIDEGGVQWMTAGSGLMHREYHERSWSAAGGMMEMIQLWVNLPRSDKMTPPAYQPFAPADMLPLVLPRGSLSLLSGDLRYCVEGDWRDLGPWPAKTHSPITIAWGSLWSEGVFTYSLPTGWTNLLLVRSGSLLLDGQQVQGPALICIRSEVSEVTLRAQPAADFAIFGGLPLGEPIASYGPFVMNTRQEIDQAVADFRSGLFWSDRF